MDKVGGQTMVVTGQLLKRNPPFFLLLFFHCVGLTKFFKNCIGALEKGPYFKRSGLVVKKLPTLIYPTIETWFPPPLYVMFRPLTTGF